MVSFFLVELCLVEYDMLKYPPSMLAAAAVYTGKRTLRRLPTWNRTIESYTTYTEDQLQWVAAFISPCVSLFWFFYLNFATWMSDFILFYYCSRSFLGFWFLYCRECAKLVVRFHLNSGNGMLIAVHKKYSTEEFSCVAELEPALFNGQRYS